MQIILLQKVRNLGDLGDQVRVRPGYGRNYLIPKGIALASTPANLEVYEQRKSELLAASNDRIAQARARAEALAGQSFTIPMRASEEGKLYGSVGPHEIAVAVADAGHEMDAAEISLAGGAIRQVGYYSATLQLHAEVEADIEVVVAQLTDLGVNLPARDSQGGETQSPAEESSVADEAQEEIAEYEAGEYGADEEDPPAH